MCMLVGAFLRAVLCEQCVGSCVSSVCGYMCPSTVCVHIVCVQCVSPRVCQVCVAICVPPLVCARLCVMCVLPNMYPSPCVCPRVCPSTCVCPLVGDVCVPICVW